MKPRKIKQEFIVFGVFLFIGVLLFSRLNFIPYLVFDEVHYVPAAKSLILGEHNLNWEHPPLAKWILGAFWWLFSYKTGLFSEPLIFRMTTACFGMGCLVVLYFILKKLSFNLKNRLASILLTALNFLWFVLSKTTVLEMFYVFFGLLGLFFLLPDLSDRILTQKKKETLAPHFLGWVFLGLSCASKWSGIGFVLTALFVQPKFKIKSLAFCALGFAGAYCLSFLPLFFLKKNGIHSAEDFFQLHLWIFQGLKQIPVGQFDYVSSAWDWPFLLRPLWFYFEPQDRNGIPYITALWCGGNPALFAIFLISFSLMVAYLLGKFRKKQKPLFGKQAKLLLALYLIPLVFWCFVPRGLKIFYYYFPSSMFLGPIVVWSLQVLEERVKREKSKNSLALGILGLNFICFFYFLPILEGRSIPESLFSSFLWFEGWK